MSEPQKSFRILSLDGGGSWAVIQVKCLQHLYGNDAKGRDILRQFDLVAANSGGSLVLAAMAADMTLAEIVEMYLNEPKRRLAFSSLKFGEIPVWLTLVKWLTKAGPRYSAKRKRTGLRELLPNLADVSIEDLPDYIGCPDTKFLISTFDYYRKRASFYRSSAKSKAQSSNIAKQGDREGASTFKKVPFLDAVHGTTNAPLNYFDEPAEITFINADESRLVWDGGVAGLNNPILTALTEALINKVSREDIQILSIGTGNKFLPLTGEAEYGFLLEPKKKPNFPDDLKKMSSSVLSDPPDAATFVSYVFLHQDLPTNTPDFIRLNPLVQPVKKGDKWSLPNGLTAADFRALVQLDMDAVRQEDVELVIRFCDAWLENKVPNQPIRDNRMLDCLLGFAWFEEGKKAFEMW